jgi:glutathione S-transferase
VDHTAPPDLEPKPQRNTDVKLYYSPLACSLASHIALEEIGAPYARERVDLHTKRTASGRDFTEVTRKSYVPVLVLDDDETLTENVAVLDWIASQNPQFAVEGPLGRTRVLEALTYISTEVHRAFKAMWHPSDEVEKTRARKTISGLLDLFGDSLAGDYIFGDRPSVADFYLFVMLLWAARFDVPVPATLAALRDRMAARPAVQTAMREEGLI